MKKLIIESICKYSQGGEISFVDSSENNFANSKKEPYIYNSRIPPV